VHWPTAAFSVVQAGLAVVADTFIVGGAASNAGTLLKPSFTWHGFQHVIVTVSATVEFVASPAALLAEWTAMNAEASGTIAFGGGANADTLNKIVGITQAGQLSNMAAFVPTDCPTREKHAWLGDALDVVCICSDFVVFFVNSIDHTSVLSAA
jgi:hypothetical protein